MLEENEDMFQIYQGNWAYSYSMRVAAWVKQVSPLKAYIYAADIREAARAVEVRRRGRRQEWRLSPLPTVKQSGEMSVKRDGYWVTIEGDIDGLSPRQARRLARRIERVAEDV